MVVKKRALRHKESIVKIDQEVSCNELANPIQYSEVIAIKASYSLEDGSEFASVIKDMPKEWQLIATSKDYLSSYALKATAYFNKTTNQLMVAIAGTNPTNMCDLVDDARLWFGANPVKFQAIQLFLDEIINCFPNNQDYTAIVTGHSLGAVIADFAAIDLLSRGITVASHSYENPGSAPLIGLALKKGLFTGKITQEQITEIDFTTINNHHNLINCLHPGVGKTDLIVTKRQSILHKDSAACSYINMAKLGLFNKVDKMLGYWGSSLARQVKEHSLENFIEHFSKESAASSASVVSFESWQGKLLAYDPRFAIAAGKNGDYWMYNIEETDEWGRVDLYKIAAEDLDI